MAYAIDKEQSQRPTRPLASLGQMPWGEALLAGLPHILYAISVYGSQLLALQAYRTSDGYVVFPFNLVFWGVVLIGLAFGWRGGWRRWSATWVGYGVLLLVELLLVLPTTGMHINEGIAIFSGILWVLLTVGILVWTTRRDWLDGFLAVLPIMPMWYSYLALDGVAGNEAPSITQLGCSWQPSWHGLYAKVTPSKAWDGSLQL